MWTNARHQALEDEIASDLAQLRDQVKQTYGSIASEPYADHHCRVGRPLAHLLGYPSELIRELPDEAVESFAGVGNPFSMGSLPPGIHVVDVGSGAGLDSFVAEQQIGDEGRVVGIDMTTSMLAKARQTARKLGVQDRVEFRQGLAEEVPVEDGWADALISNGVVNLCADKLGVFREMRRVLRPGGVLQFAEVATGRTFSEATHPDICLASALRLGRWIELLEEAGFERVRVGDPVDIFAGARGEREARQIDLQGYPFFAVSGRRGVDRADARSTALMRRPKRSRA
jgi:arsenite methyltransferase